MVQTNNIEAKIKAEQIRLIDFGFSDYIRENGTNNGGSSPQSKLEISRKHLSGLGVVYGTYGYMAPELFNKNELLKGCKYDPA